jgi:HEPN domain-containing protein
MEKKQVIALWLQKAENDLKICEQGLKADEIITDVICFHCQQAAEKYLKSYLLFKDKEITKTHNIAFLLTKCIEFDSDFSILKDIIYLTNYAVQVRYPDDFFMPGITETEQAFIDAARVKKFVLDKLNNH